jgi:hypothetical protein
VGGIPTQDAGSRGRLQSRAVGFLQLLESLQEMSVLIANAVHQLHALVREWVAAVHRGEMLYLPHAKEVRTHPGPMGGTKEGGWMF